MEPIHLVLSITIAEEDETLSRKGRNNSLLGLAPGKKSRVPETRAMMSGIYLFAGVIMPPSIGSTQHALAAVTGCDIVCLTLRKSQINWLASLAACLAGARAWSLPSHS